ncbi:MAG: hypothetical protein LUC39_08420 [Clostridiales bacterium]|nr:hypothetical protein [Clostridiales bacterium]
MTILLLGIGVGLLSVILRLAAAMRLAIPLLYALLLPLLAPEWYHAHQTVGDGIFFGLVGLVILSWAVTLVRRLRG